MEEQKGQSLNHYSFLSSGAFFAFLGIKKNQDPLQGLRGCKGRTVRWMTESVYMLPVLPAERLLVSIRDSGELLLPFLFLLLLLLGQSPLEVLDHSILLLLWPITLTLLVERG